MLEWVGHLHARSFAMLGALPTGFGSEARRLGETRGDLRKLFANKDNKWTGQRNRGGDN